MSDLEKTIDTVLKKHPAGRADELVDILHDLQAALRWLPPEALRAAALHCAQPLSEVFGVATFYEGFYLKPRGEHICTVCMGTACHVRGSRRLLEQLERDLGVPSGQTTPDRKFTLQEVNCVGACALGPLLIVDQKYHGQMTPAKASKLVSKLRG